jgi:threonine dehydrogenase-like Zn-dependent dehydrogenase
MQITRSSSTETVPDAMIAELTDAVVRVTRACICGSDVSRATTLRLVPCST